MASPSDKPRDLFLDQVLESTYQPGVSYRLDQKLGKGGTAPAYLAMRTAAADESQFARPKSAPPAPPRARPRARPLPLA
jgi:hypothetical protein